MRKKMLANGLLIILLAATCGCQSFTAEEAEIHDEIFSYELSFDKTFLTVIDVIEKTPGWTLDSTDQVSGLIGVRASGMNAKPAMIVLKRIEKKHVTLELSRDTQRVRNIGQLLKDIDAALINA